MKKLIFTLPLLSMIVLLLAFHAPEVTISGKVTSGGEGVPGVDVSVRDSNQGTVTNMKGDYSLDVGSKADTLIFSSLGYQTQKIAIEGRTTINVQLQEE